jgi:hypothetical protein
MVNSQKLAILCSIVFIWTLFLVFIIERFPGRYVRDILELGVLTSLAFGDVVS